MTTAPAQEDTMTTATLRTPVEVDTDLAAAYNTLHDALDLLTRTTDTIRHIYAERVLNQHVRYTRRGPQFPPEATIEAAIDYLRNLNPGTNLLPYPGDVARYLAQYDERKAARDAAYAEIGRLNKEYRGWSRFFLVTSSAGHIHASMGCSTCRPTTTYGWLPELSGQTEAEAVARLGAVLCSVCFPTAPTENTGGRITKAHALRMAHEALAGAR